jgi:ubiquinone/menaquinone biosynthesis C-methylase UbiE
MPPRTETPQVDPYDYFAAMQSGSRAERLFHKRRIARLVEACAPSGRTVLEVGAGSGCLAIPLAEAGGEVTALEPGTEHLERLAARAAERGLEIAGIEGDGALLPFPGDRFDVVVLASVVHLIDDPRPLLAEAERVVRPGGRLVIAGPWRFHPKSSRLIKTILRGGRPPKKRVRSFSARKLRRFLPESRLEGVGRDRLIGYDVSTWTVS